MRVLALIFSLLLASCGAEIAKNTAHMRVVSTSLCGDTYVLDGVPHEYITALSWQSDDNISTAPESFKGKPKAFDDAERLLALNPTLVVFGPGEGQAAKPLLDKRNIKHISLKWGEDFESVEENMQMLLSALGSPANEPRSVSLSAHAQRDPGSSPGSEAISILYLSASGATAGPGTYVDAAIQIAGGSNIITTSGWHTPRIESLVILKPDLIVTSFFRDGYASVNEAGWRNKMLQDKINSTPHINVPGKLWPCAGPRLYEATNIIAKAIGELK